MSYVPSALQCFDVCPSAAHTSESGTHWPAHFPVLASQMKGQAVAWSSIQTPELLQVCGLPLLHWCSFAVQGRHIPWLQVDVVHVVVTVQWPVDEQVRTEFPAHWGAVPPGGHSPAHWPTVESQM